MIELYNMIRQTHMHRVLYNMIRQTHIHGVTYDMKRQTHIHRVLYNIMRQTHIHRVETKGAAATCSICITISSTAIRTD